MSACLFPFSQAGLDARSLAPSLARSLARKRRRRRARIGFGVGIKSIDSQTGSSSSSKAEREAATRRDSDCRLFKLCSSSAAAAGASGGGSNERVYVRQQRRRRQASEQPSLLSSPLLSPASLHSLTRSLACTSSRSSTVARFLSILREGRASRSPLFASSFSLSRSRPSLVALPSTHTHNTTLTSIPSSVPLSLPLPVIEQRASPCV